MGCVPILICPELNTILGAGMIFGCGVVYGFMALGKKYVEQQLHSMLSSLFSGRIAAR